MQGAKQMENVLVNDENLRNNRGGSILRYNFPLFFLFTIVYILLYFNA